MRSHTQGPQDFAEDAGCVSCLEGEKLGKGQNRTVPLKYFVQDSVCLVHYLILQSSKFFKNMTKLISLASSIMPMNLNQTTEWLGGKENQNVDKIF